MIDLETSRIPAATRRAVLRATAGALGLAGMGTASAHEWGSRDSDSELIGASPRGGQTSDEPGAMHNAEVVGYHSLGGVGSASTAGRPSMPHHGGQTELRTRGDYAYVTFFSSDRPTPGRGMAIVDISDYNDADSKADLANAEPTVLSFVRNNSTATACMDLKVDDTGDYVFIGTQPYTALFSTPNENDDPDSARHKIETNEANDPTPNTGDHSGTEVSGAVIAVDVSDKGNPQRVDAFPVSGTGIHNLFHHRIGGDDYVFAIHDLNDGTEGIYVFRFHRDAGRLELVNRWTADGNYRQGDAGAEMNYIHDLEVHDDPRTGRPTIYLAYWGNGLQVLDASDPENLELLGVFEMDACHFATSLPMLVDGRRVAIASQEISASDESTGTVHLVDAEGIYPDADGELTDGVEFDDNGVASLSEHDKWEWQHVEDVDHAAIAGTDVDFSNFELSPHNSDLSRHVTQRGNSHVEHEEFWLHQGHYHGGIRFLRLDTNSWTFEDRGFARPRYEEVPDESTMEGLTDVRPNCWTAVESNGVTFASDINQGIHAVAHDDIPLGGAPPVIDVARSTDSSVHTGGATTRVDLAVEHLERADSVRLRDRVPPEYTVYEYGDAATTYTEGGAQMVEFEADATDGDEFTYLAGVADGLEETGGYTLGPVEVSVDDGRSWHAVAGTIDGDVVVGQGTGSGALTLGSAAGVMGFAYHQRERLRDRLAAVLDRQE